MMDTKSERPRSHARAAVILCLVLIVIAVLALSGYAFCQFTATQQEAIQIFGWRDQVECGTDSGIAFVRSILANSPSGRDKLGGIFDNPELMRDVIVRPDDDPRMQVAFSVVSPVVGDATQDSPWRYGVESESARLNINHVLSMATPDKDARAILMQLPSMTAEIADGILDWLDSDDDPRLGGAESEYYAGLDPPYAPRNGPLRSVDELLMVRGVTADLLYYGDEESIGWANLLTVHSREQNPELEGPERIDVNQPDMRRLYDQLMKVFNKQWAMFIVALRQNGPHDGPVTLESALTRELDLSLPATHSFQHPLDLFLCNVQVTLAGDTQPIVLPSPFTDGESMKFNLAELRKNLIFNKSPIIDGRINIMQAPRAVLLTLPHISPPRAEAIIALRDSLDTEQKQRDAGELWLLEAGIVDLAEMRDLVHHVTSGGDIFRAQVIGYSGDGKIETRAGILIDTANRCRLLGYDDLSKTARGLHLQQQ